MTTAVLPFLPDLLENLSDDDAVQGLLLGVAKKLDLPTLEIQQEEQVREAQGTPGFLMSIP